MCFLCCVPTSALEKDNLLSFAPLLFARVNAVEEYPAVFKEEHARQLHSSLHSTPQRSHHWFVINACKGNICFVSAVNTRQYKDPFYLLPLSSMKKKIVLLKAPFFSTSTNGSVFLAIFHTSVLVPVQFDPHQLKWMQQFFIPHILVAAHAMFWMRYIGCSLWLPLCCM